MEGSSMLTDHEHQADLEAEQARMGALDYPASPVLGTLTKPWYTSKGIWGGILAAAAPILGFIGYEFGPEQIETCSIMLAAIGGAIGGIVAAYGRLKAEKVIG